VAFSLVLTYVDLATDLYACFLMIEQGQYSFAHATLGILGVSMATQLAIAFGQNYRNVPFMLKEMALTVLLMKPVVDTARVVRGYDKKPHQLLSPFFEHLLSKAAEVAIEAGPCAILQVWALLLAPNPNAGQLVTIVFSAICACWVVAAVSFAVDVAPRSRFAEPNFFGIVPDSASQRLLMLGVMTLASTCKMLALMLALGLLLASRRGIIIAAVYGLRMAIMFLFKAVRRELAAHYATRGPITVVLGFFEHTVTAVLSDFTDLTLARHPYVLLRSRWFGM
jgi:hypothetical protein